MKKQIKKPRLTLDRQLLRHLQQIPLDTCAHVQGGLAANSEGATCSVALVCTTPH